MPFRAFTVEHAITSLIGLVLMATIFWLGRKGTAWRNRMAALLAFANLLSYPFNLVAWRSLGEPIALDNLLPLHLCDIAAIIAGFALLTQKPLLRELTYFWGLAFTFQALVTPSVVLGFPHLPFFSFFSQHYAIVTTSLFLPFVDGWRPRTPIWKSPLVALGFGTMYMLLALLINALLGTNFGFVNHPPATTSLIDHLGPWPLYLLSLLGISLAVFFLLSLPFLKRTASPCTPAA